MSIRAVAWAFDQFCPTPLAKLVLIKLADCANEEGECWPAQAKIAADCGISRETVNRQIRILVDAGMLRAEHRINGMGKQANHYFLRCDQQSHQSRPNVILRHIPPCDPPSHPDVITGSHQEPSIEKKEKVEGKPSTLEKEEALAADFERFWWLYPRRDDKKPALIAYRAARKKTGAAEIDAGAQRYARIRAGQEERFTKLAATWLNAECWLNEDAPQENGHDRRSPRFDRNAEAERQHAEALDILAQAALDFDRRQGGGGTA